MQQMVRMCNVLFLRSIEFDFNICRLTYICDSRSYSFFHCSGMIGFWNFAFV